MGGYPSYKLVNAWNYRDLPALMGFFGKLSRTHREKDASPLEVFFSMINGVGQDRAPSLAKVRLADPGF